MSQDFYLIKNTYLHLQNIMVYGMINKYQTLIHTTVTLLWTLYYMKLNLLWKRIYKKGDVLARHKDRYSCEISTTLNLGGEPWPIYLDPTEKTGQAGIEVNLDPGDMLIYSGCDLEHWREEFKGKNCGQVFLHYNNLKGKNAKANLYDKRIMLGLPSYFKGFTIRKK
jgi:hypothetical protein